MRKQNTSVIWVIETKYLTKYGKHDWSCTRRVPYLTRLEAREALVALVEIRNEFSDTTHKYRIRKFLRCNGMTKNYTNPQFNYSR